LIIITTRGREKVNVIHYIGKIFNEKGVGCYAFNKELKARATERHSSTGGGEERREEGHKTQSLC
jgi:hypothetical protein